MATPPEEETCEVLCVHQAAVDEVRAHTPSPQQFADMAGLFKLFGDATRIKILWSLSQHELCVCDLADLIGMNQSAVSHQLRILKQGRLVKSRRDGKSIFTLWPMATWRPCWRRAWSIFPNRSKATAAVQG